MSPPSPGRARGEAGQTLVELMAVVLLFSIVMVVLFEALSSMTTAVTGTERRLVNLDEARTLMAVATKDVRTATRLQAGTSPFVLADANEVIFYANLNNPNSGPKKVRIFVDTDAQLIEEVYTPDVGSVAPNYTYSGAPTRRFVGRYVDNAETQPIFRYFDGSDPQQELLPTPLSAGNRLAVHSVRITLAIRKQSTFPVAPTTVVNEVRLPNVDYQEVTG